MWLRRRLATSLDGLKALKIPCSSKYTVHISVLEIANGEELLVFSPRQTVGQSRLPQVSGRTYPFLQALLYKRC